MKKDFFLCGFAVDVILQPNEGGGSFSFPYERVPRAKMTIGLNRASWADVEITLLHEALEFVVTSLGHRFHSDDWTAGTCSTGSFMQMTHDQFSDVVTRVARFLVEVEPEVRKAWKAARKAEAKGRSRK